MRQSEFFKLFEDADVTKFLLDDDDTVIFIERDGSYTDVESPAFFDNASSVSYLNLNMSDMKEYKRNPLGFLAYKRRVEKLSHESQDMSWLNLKTLNEVIHDKQEAEGQHWGPIEWNTNNSKIIPKVKRIFGMRKKMDVEHFRAFVTEQDYFQFQVTLPKIVVPLSRKFDLSDPKNMYSRVMKAMYVLSYLGGISLKNLKSENPIAKSLAHFYFFYFIQKVFHFPDLFKNYDASVLEKLHWEFNDVSTHWVWWHPRMKMDVKEFQRKGNENIQNIRRIGKKVYYDIVGDLREDIGSDYKTLLMEKSSGLTRVGQILFQESTQAYVFCVLGAQVKTRWKIVGDNVKSFQTQTVFQDQLVPERIALNNLTKLISDLRLAVRDSKVRLDFCISPGLVLIPSQMVFIEDSPGYNNIITVASDQKFGVNNVNRIKKKEEEKKRELVKKAVGDLTKDLLEPERNVENKNEVKSVQNLNKNEQNLSKSITKNEQVKQNIQSKLPVEGNLQIFAESLVASLVIRALILLL